MRLKNLAILLVSGFVLCSCAVHNTDFVRCGNAQGQKCTSVSKIDKMIDRGLITDDDDELGEEERPQAPKTNTVSTNSKKKQKKSKRSFEVWMPSTNATAERYV